MLNRCGGNREATAQFLGIGRTSLYRYLKKLDYKNERVQPGSDFRAN
jgi:DNA-binding NtrC family response regulator